MFLPAWTCLIASELWKMFTLLSHQNWNLSTRLTASISSLFVPGYLLHQQQQLKIKTHGLLHIQDQQTEHELLQVQERNRQNLVLRNHLRSVENSLEHLPLFVIGNFFLVWNQDQSGEEASDILLGDEELFIAASVAISALSAFRGQGSIFFCHDKRSQTKFCQLRFGSPTMFLTCLAYLQLLTKN